MQKNQDQLQQQQWPNLEARHLLAKAHHQDSLHLQQLKWKEIKVQVNTHATIVPSNQIILIDK